MTRRKLDASILLRNEKHTPAVDRTFETQGTFGTTRVIVLESNDARSRRVIKAFIRLALVQDE